MKEGTIFSICISSILGSPKQEVQEATITIVGIENDKGEWGKDWGRQISILSLSSLLSVGEEDNTNICPGICDENILVDGIDLYEIMLGDRIALGTEVILEVTQIGKESCSNNIRKGFINDLLAYEGIFCKVIKPGKIKKGDSFIVLCSAVAYTEK